MNSAQLTAVKQRVGQLQEDLINFEEVSRKRPGHVYYEDLPYRRTVEEVIASISAELLQLTEGLEEELKEYDNRTEEAKEWLSLEMLKARRALLARLGHNLTKFDRVFGELP